MAYSSHYPRVHQAKYLTLLLPSGPNETQDWLDRFSVEKQENCPTIINHVINSNYIQPNQITLIEEVM